MLKLQLAHVHSRHTAATARFCTQYRQASYMRTCLSRSWHFSRAGHTPLLKRQSDSEFRPTKSSPVALPLIIVCKKKSILTARSDVYLHFSVATEALLHPRIVAMLKNWRTSSSVPYLMGSVRLTTGHLVRTSLSTAPLLARTIHRNLFCFSTCFH